ALMLMLEKAVTPSRRGGFPPGGCRFVRFQLVAPDSSVDVYLERQLLLRNDLCHRACRGPEQAIAPVDVDRPRALAHRPQRLHHAALWTPLRHPAEIGD